MLHYVPICCWNVERNSVMCRDVKRCSKMFMVEVFKKEKYNK